MIEGFCPVQKLFSDFMILYIGFLQNKKLCHNLKILCPVFSKCLKQNFFLLLETVVFINNRIALVKTAENIICVRS